jgi:hypothetical protein
MLNLTSLAVLAANAEYLDCRSVWNRFAGRKKANSKSEKEFRRLSWFLRGAVLVWLVGSISEPCATIWGLIARTEADAPQSLANLIATGAYVPKDLANFILDKKIPGRIFHDYENSSYYQWRFGGEPPLFIDVLNAYPDQLCLDYYAIVEMTPHGQKLLDERDIGYVVLTRFRGGPSLMPLTEYLLSQQARWKQVYGSQDGYIFARRTAAYEYLTELPRSDAKSKQGTKN